MKTTFFKALNAVLFILIASITTVTAQQVGLQFINNSADPTNPAIDIYIDGNLSSDDLYYATATGYKSVTAGVTLNIGIAAAGSASVNDTLKNYEVIFNNAENYVAMICGVFDTALFLPNPGSLYTGLQLIIKGQVIKSAINPVTTDFTFMNGVTDMDSVDIVARLNGIQFDNILYTSITGYNTLQPIDYTFDITPYADNTDLWYTYDVDFSTFQGYALTMFLSGFNDPNLNQGGPPVTLYGVDSLGSVTAFPFTQRARFQAIHNSADPALDSIDIYMFGVPVLTDFKFRTATAFLDVPAGVTLTIGIAPGNSVSEADTVKSLNLLFENGKTYVAFASGVLNPGSFAPNPSGIDLNFKMVSDDVYKEQASNGSEVDFVIAHGITDADSVDVKVQAGATLANDISYGMVSSYNTLAAGKYYMDVTSTDGLSTIATYDVDLGTHAGSAGVLFFSGFADSVANQNGAGVELFIAWPDGVVELQQEVNYASLQFIHNAADPALAMVDVYRNGSLWLNDFEFQQATAFENVETSVVQNIGLAPSNSTTVNDTVINISLALLPDVRYCLLANGVLNPPLFVSNPDGIPIDLQFILLDNLKGAATNSGDVDFVTVHGITDAPTVDAEFFNVGMIGTNVAYTGIIPYYSVAAGDYFLNVFNTGGVIPIRTYFAPLATHAGKSAVVFASGFIDPVPNQNGEADMLFAAFTDGTVIPFNNTTSTNEVSNNAISIFPNPANDFLVINSNDASEYEIEITDAFGRKVFSEKQNQLQSHTVDVSNYSNGLYFIKLIANGKVSACEKFIVQ